MPIAAENRARYPADWPAIRARILARAGNRCEGSPKYRWCRAENGKPHPDTHSHVVLTIAHLNHVVEDCSDENLKALCNRCHLTHDAAHHAKNAAATRRKQKRNGELFDDGLPPARGAEGA